MTRRAIKNALHTTSPPDVLDVSTAFLSTMALEFKDGIKKASDSDMRWQIEKNDQRAEKKTDISHETATTLGHQ